VSEAAPPNAAKPDAERALVDVGEVGRPQGLQGEVRVHLYNIESEILEGDPPLELVLPDGAVRAARVESLRYTANFAIVGFEGVVSREDADALRGAVLRVPRSELGPTEPDEYFVCDLVGCRALLDEQVLGTVERVLPYPTCDVLVVARADGSRVEVPMHESFVAEVRIEAREVRLRTIDGLE
jgi:16S rRNA processing protein RimM